MNRNLLLARANIRKSKGQTAAIIALVLLSSIMLNLWLILATDYKQNFDRWHDKLNDGHISLAAYADDESYRDFICDTIENSNEVTEYHLADALVASGSFDYNGGNVMSNFVILDKETAVSRDVGKFEITGEEIPESGVYLPLLYGTEHNYSAGDKIKLTLDNETFEYTVCGFFNNTMTASHNCGMLSLLLTEDKFNELSEKGSIPKAAFASIRIRDKMKSEKKEAELVNTITKKYPNILLSSNYYEAVVTARYISQMICSGILSALAFFILLIGTVVITSNVANYIQEDMQNLGALKALGYTSRQLVCSLILQFLGISVISTTLGIALSYCIFPPLNDMMIAQTGIPYAVKFFPLPCLITFSCISGIVSAAVYLSARRIQKLEPITAIRQGISTHNFKKNHVPLKKTMLPLHPALAMKTTLSRRKQNITTCITTLVISLILVFSSVMLENVIVNMQPFLDMIAGEMADSCINVNVSGEDCAFTREGYKKMATLQNASYYITLTEGTNIDAFNDEVSKRFGSDINTTLNIVSVIEGSGSVYVALVKVIVAAVLVLSSIIIVFVMYLLVRTLLNNKKRDYGILKALGYTTGQLILQTAMSFMPAIIFSAVLGIFFSMQIINPLLVVFLNGIGIVKSTFSVPVGFNLIAGIGLVLFAFAAACLMSLRVRKITPRELLSGE